MALHVTSLDPETLAKLGIELELPLGQAGARHIALGKVLKAIAQLEEGDALWVLQEARRTLGNQGDVLTTGNTSEKYAPPLGWTIQVVARHFKLSVIEMKRRSRIPEIVQARQVAMYILGMSDVYTLAEIGKALGGRSPATVSHGFQRVAGQLNRNKHLSELVNAIREELC